MGLILSGSLTGNVSAQAQNASMMGQSDAAACYKATRASNTSGLNACNRALKQQSLTRRDRGATHLNRGVILVRLKRFEEAANDYSEALKILPNLPEAYLNRGNAYLYMGDFNRAIKDYDRALKHGIKPAHNAYFNRGVAHESKFDTERAYNDFQQALTLKPDWVEPLDRLLRYERNEYKKEKSGM